MLLEAMDNKQLSIVILLDMSKAFEGVDHNMLLQRILNLGVTSAVHNSEFLKALFYRRFYLIYTQIACLQFPTVVVLNHMLTLIRKHFYSFHCRIWNIRYCI
jgi:hypothetical protein